MSEARSESVICGAVRPGSYTSQSSRRWSPPTCTLPAGHDGDHIEQLSFVTHAWHRSVGEAERPIVHIERSKRGPKRPLPEFLRLLAALIERRVETKGVTHRYWVLGFRPYLRIGRKWQVIVVREVRSDG